MQIAEALQDFPIIIRDLIFLSSASSVETENLVGLGIYFWGRTPQAARIGLRREQLRIGPRLRLSLRVSASTDS